MHSNPNITAHKKTKIFCELTLSNIDGIIHLSSYGSVGQRFTPWLRGEIFRFLVERAWETKQVTFVEKLPSQMELNSWGQRIEYKDSI